MVVLLVTVLGVPSADLKQIQTGGQTVQQTLVLPELPGMLRAHSQVEYLLLIILMIITGYWGNIKQYTA